MKTNQNINPQLISADSPRTPFTETFFNPPLNNLHEIRENILEGDSGSEYSFDKKKKYLYSEKGEKESKRLLKNEFSFSSSNHDECPEGITIMGTIFSIIKSIIGAGFLFLPKGFALAGWLMALIILALSCILIIIGTIKLIEAKEKIGGTYSYMAYSVFGKPFRIYVEINLVLCQVAGCTGFLVFCTNTLIASLANWGVEPNRFYIGIGYFIILVPMVFFRDISKFTIFYFVGDILFIILMLTGEIYSLEKIGNEGIGDVSLVEKDTWLIVLGMSIYAFENIPVIIPIYQKMAKRKGITIALNISFVLIYIFYASYALLNYLAYGKKIKILSTDELENTTFNQIIKFSYLISLIPTYMIAIFPANKIIERYWKVSEELSFKDTLIKNLSRMIVVIFTIVMTFSFASHWDKIMAFVGSSVIIPICFLFPGIVHVAKVATSLFDKIVDWILIIVGVVSVVLTLYVTFKYWDM